MLSKKYKYHFFNNLKLAYPVTLSQLGHMLTALADTLMIGWLGAIPLAAVAFGHSIFSMFFIIGIGLATGLTPLVGKANGLRNQEECSNLLSNGIVANTLYAIGLMVLLYLIIGIFDFLGQDPEVVVLSMDYYLVMIWSLLPFMLFLAFKQFLEGLRLTKPAMIVTIIANTINVILNYILIFGKLGFPEMGVAGAAWSTFIARVLMLVLILLLMLKTEKLKAYLKELNFIKVKFQKLKEITKMGLPIGMQFAMEVSAFSVGSIIVGTISAEALAAHQIALNLAATTFMMAGGLGTAATISLSNFLGMGLKREIRNSGFMSVYMVLGFMSVSAIIFIVFNEILPSLYIDNPEVLSIAAVLMIVAGFFQLSDGLQVVILGALRGIHDVKIPTVMTIIGYWVLTIPSGYILVNYFNFGALGVWYGYLIGLTFTALTLTYRFHLLTKKIIVEK
jgi:MATE family multidrug resistance protein